MTAIFITILNMSITASIIALAVMLVRIPLRKSPKVFSYALWGVVLFRLVFPFSFESIFGLMPTNTNTIPQDIIFPSNPAIQNGGQLANVPIGETLNTAASAVVSENAGIPVQLIFEIAGYVWLLGFVALLVYAAVGYVNVKRRVYFATLVQDNIYESDKIKTPFVLGFINPKIYFPVSIDPNKHGYILKHEQVHVKRRDYLIKPFAYIVFALHWFNPIMWIAYFLMSKDMEMSCDEAVLRQTSEDIRREYSTALLNLSVERISILSPVAFAFGESNVKERVRNVLSFKKPAKWITVVSVVALAVFLVGFASNSTTFAIDTPTSFSGGGFAELPNFTVHSDTAVGRNFTAEEAAEIGMSALSRYFSNFRFDWGNWDNAEVFMMFTERAYWADDSGIFQAIPVWSGIAGWQGAIEHDTDSAPFRFTINAETGELMSVSFVPRSDYTERMLSTFADRLREALGTHSDIPVVHSNRWHIEPEHENMIIEFALQSFFGAQALEVAEYLNNGYAFNVTANIGSLSDPIVTATTQIVYPSGESVIVGVFVSEEESFRDFTIIFPNAPIVNIQWDYDTEQSPEEYTEIEWEYITDHSPVVEMEIHDEYITEESPLRTELMNP